MDFEHIFHDNIQLITSKIEKTRDFDIVIKSINLDNLFLIKNKEKIIFTYLDFLKKNMKLS